MKLLQPDICQNFYRYERVRRGGKYNMIMDARLAMIEAELSAKEYADVISHYSEYIVIGLDAEQADRRQVLKVRDKFLNASEQQFIAPDDLAAHIVAWTAKEAIIKAERNSAIDWTDGIVIKPFAANTDETVLRAHCGDRTYALVCRLIEGHYMTHAVACQS